MFVRRKFQGLIAFAQVAKFRVCTTGSFGSLFWDYASIVLFNERCEFGFCSVISAMKFEANL